MTRRSGTRWIAVGLAAMFVLLAAVTSAATAHPATHAATKPTFNMLAVVPLSGAFAVPGALETRGLAAAAHVINAQGGILGRRVTIKTVDSQTSGNVAISAALQELSSGSKYHAILAGIAGFDAPPLAGALAKTPLLQISSASEDSLNNPKSFPNLFMSGTGFAGNAEGVALQLKKDKITSIGIICGDSTSGRNGAAAVQEAADRAGIKVTSTVFVPITAADATPQMQQVLASKPQALVSAAFTPATPAIIKARTKLGASTPFYGDAFFSAANFGAFASGDDMKGIKLEVFPYLVKGNPAQKNAYWKNFAAAVGRLDPHPLLQLNAAIVTYNALMVVRAAALKAKSLDTDKLVKALQGITSVKQVPGFVGGPNSKFYSSSNHSLATSGKDFIWVNAGPTVDGLIVPQS